MVSALVAQDLDLSGEQHLGLGAVAVDGRVGDVQTRCDSDEPRGSTARLPCRLAISEYHLLDPTKMGWTEIARMDTVGGRKTGNDIAGVDNYG